MKLPVKIVLPAAICIFSLFTLFLFRTVPESRLWKGWTVFYVSNGTVTEAQVNRILAEKGCKNVISKSNQRIPIVSPFSPLQGLSEESYIQQRNAFFSDEDNTAMIFYVPDSESSKLSQAIADLERLGADCGTDGTTAFPYLAPLGTLALALICILFSKRRRFFAPATVFMVALAFSRPLFTVAACASLAIAGFFILLKIYGRQGFFRRTIRSPLAVLLLIAPLFILCASNPLNAVFYMLAVLGAISVIKLIDAVLNFYFRNAFSPVYIRTAYEMPLISAIDIKALASLTLSCIFILLSSLWGKTSHASVGTSTRCALPAPVSHGVLQGLPDLDDFLAWSWKTATFPYRKLSESTEEYYPEEGELVTMPVYTEENGRIESRQEPVLSFNADFREKVFVSLKALDYPALETMLLKQGLNARYAYVRGGGVSVERLGSILLSVCTAISLAITAYFMLRKRRYGFGK